MAGSKKKPKKQKRPIAPARRASAGKATTKKAASKVAPAKGRVEERHRRPVAKPTSTRKDAPRPKPAQALPAPSPALGRFSESLRAGRAGTGFWFRVADGIEHAVLRRVGVEGRLVAVTDAGSEVELAATNAFETPSEARALGRPW